MASTEEKDYSYHKWNDQKLKHHNKQINKTCTVYLVGQHMP